MSSYLIDVRSIDQKVKIPPSFCLQGRENKLKVKLQEKDERCLLFWCSRFKQYCFLFHELTYDIVFLRIFVLIIFQEYAKG
jgi:hypothetical protein